MKRQLPTVCIVSPNIWPVFAGSRDTTLVGGAEMRLSALSRALSQANLNVSIASLDFGQGDLTEMDGIQVIGTHSPNAGFPLLSFVHPRITTWWRALARANADIYIQSCAGYLTALTAIFCRVNQRKFIYSGACDPDFDLTQTDKLFNRRAGRRDQALFLWGLKRAHAIVTQHPGQTEALKRYHNRDGVEIPNGYPTPKSTREARHDGLTPPLILWVATMRSWKRPELFLDLAERLPEMRFRMIGGPAAGEESHIFDEIKSRAERLSNVDFRGFVPFADIDQHFDEAGIFVNTSDYEGFPNTFLQSWSRAIPTVSFIDTGARSGPEKIGVTCVNIEEMVAAVSDLAMKQSSRKRIGQRSAEYFLANHSVEHSVQLYSELFRSLRS